MKARLALKKLHPSQQFIVKNAKRFNHLRCGRRFGKTTLIEELCLPAVEKWPVGIWYPTGKDMSEVWKDMKQRYKNLITEKNETLKQITLVGGGMIDFWSMDEPESGQGRKYKRAIIDESAKAPKLYLAWENTIRPTLTDYIGDAYILSRPKGKNNAFYQLEEKHKAFDNWAFFHYTTYDNPFIDKNEIEEARSQLDDLNFRQEYMAEYVDANDRPFLYVFDEKKHVIDSYTPNPNLNILISFDFNKEPMTCGISQKPTFKSSVRFDEIKLDSGSTPELCDRIIAKYPQYLGKMDVTGDATGANRTPMVLGNINHYTIIKQKLGLKDFNLKVEKKNMELAASRILCNSVLQNADIKITKNCQQTIQDCKMAAVDDQGELIKTAAQGLHCFVGNTQVLTISGPLAIDKIKTGDLVITRSGVRSVRNIFNNGQRKVCEYVLTLDNTKLTLICTPDHHIFTNQGWLPISRLTPGMMVISAKTLMAESSKSTGKGNTLLHPLRKKCLAFIGLFGNFTKERFLKASMCTIKTRTNSTIISKIWNYLVGATTYPSTFKSDLLQIQNIFRDWQRLVRSGLLNGARLMRVTNLELSMVRGLPVNTDLAPERTSSYNASFAGKITKQKKKQEGQNSVAVIVNQHGEEDRELMMKLEFAKTAGILLESISTEILRHVDVSAVENMEQVYDIAVEGEHEYFANGLLVHNCFDNFRYEINAAFEGFIKNPHRYT